MKDGDRGEAGMVAGHGRSQTPTVSRTLVIVLAEVMVIVVLLVLWSALRRGKTSR
jgi:hypothetical protein